MAFTELTASNPSRMPYVMCMLDAPVLSRSQLPYSVSSHSPQSCQAPPPFIRVQINPDAHSVCTRPKNHYDPQQVHRLFSSDTVGTEDTPDRAMARRGGGNRNKYVTVIEEMSSRVAFSKLMNARQVVCTLFELVAVASVEDLVMQYSSLVVALDSSPILSNIRRGTDDILSLGSVAA
jgi:hypothetical protein